MRPKVTAVIVAVLMVFSAVLYWSVTRADAVRAQQMAAAAPAAGVQTVAPKEPYNSDHAQLLVEKEKRAQSEEMVLELRYRQQMTQDPAYVKLLTDFNANEKELAAWIDGVRKANGWDASYNYDRETNTWTHTAGTKGTREQGTK